jgi:TolA-binding protein
LTEIIVAVISGLITLIGVMLQNKATTDKMSTDMQMSQAVMNTKLEELTREVRSHNNFAQRMPVVEEQIRVINHRIADLEKGGD